MNGERARVRKLLATGYGLLAVTELIRLPKLSGKYGDLVIGYVLVFLGYCLFSRAFWRVVTDLPEGSTQTTLIGSFRLLSGGALLFGVGEAFNIVWLLRNGGGGYTLAADVLGAVAWMVIARGWWIWTSPERD